MDMCIHSDWSGVGQCPWCRIAELEAKLGDMNKRRLHWIEVHGGDSIRIEEMLKALKDAKDQVNYLMCCFAPTRADAENTAAVIRDIDDAIAKAKGASDR